VTTTVIIAVMGRNWPKSQYYHGNGYVTPGNTTGTIDYSNAAVAVTGLSVMLCRCSSFSALICVDKLLLVHGLKLNR